MARLDATVCTRAYGDWFDAPAVIRVPCSAVIQSGDAQSDRSIDLHQPPVPKRPQLSRVIFHKTSRSTCLMMMPPKARTAVRRPSAAN